MNELILAIDLGTSGPKVALVSPLGHVLACEIGKTELIILPDGGVEQDPDGWWEAIARTTRTLLAQTAVSTDRIIAIGCTAQWSGTVAVAKDGQALMNAIIWMDSRGAPYVHQITNGPIKIEGYGLNKLVPWLRLTGGIPVRSGKDPIAHILFIKHRFPEIYRHTHQFLEPKDYLNFRLTGQYAASYDSITLHWLTDNRDINNIRYSKRLIKLSTIDRAKLPPLRQSVDILGPLLAAPAAALGLPSGIPVIMGTPDIQSAALGSGAIRDFQPHLYLGTSSWLTCHLPYKKTDLFHNMASLPSAVPGKYFIANEQETAGGALAFMRDNLLFPEDGLTDTSQPTNLYALFDQLVAQVPAGSGQLIFTPWLHGERTPVDDRLVRGGFHNIGLATTRSHMIRAVFEGVAYNSRWLLGYVEKFIKRRLDDIHMIGGGAQSDIWCQIHADVLDRRIKQVQAPIQANARGVALLAAVALGLATFDTVGEDVPIARTYEPNPVNRALYDQLFTAYLEIYQRNKRLYARLNKEKE